MNTEKKFEFVLFFRYETKWNTLSPGLVRKIRTWVRLCVCTLSRMICNKIEEKKQTLF